MATNLLNRDPQPCTLVRIACERCGPVRMAARPQTPVMKSHPCPVCGEISLCSKLGTGQTTRTLPFAEREDDWRHLFRDGDRERDISRNARLFPKEGKVHA